MNRRAQTRLLDCDPVTVRWNDGTCNLEQIAQVDDVSLGGMRLLVNPPIPLGAQVSITYDSLFTADLSGSVRHHLKCAEGTFVGVEFKGQHPEAMLVRYPDLFLGAD